MKQWVAKIYRSERSAKILKDCCEVELKHNNVAEVIWIGKYTERKKRPL